MKLQHLIIALILTFSTINLVLSQNSTEVEMANELTQEAIELMDNGEYESSIIKLEAAKALDPNNYVYDYEIAYAYNLQQQYPKAIEILEQLVKEYETFNDQCYQNLGNFYDLNDQPDKAMEAYERGIEKFPNSGRIYLEMGVVTAQREKEYEKALGYWEKGIEVAPYYSSNYFHATNIMSLSDQKMWAILYGEAFLLLEPSGERHKMISKLVFDLHNSCVEIEKGKKGDLSTSFCRTTIMTPEALSAGKLPLSLNYELGMTLGLTLAVNKQIRKSRALDFDAVVMMRSTFLSFWQDKELDKEFPLAVFDFEKRVNEEGHLEAYQRWLLMYGDIKAFEAYLKENENTFLKFWDWFKESSFEIEQENAVVRSRF